MKMNVYLPRYGLLTRLFVGAGLWLATMPAATFITMAAPDDDDPLVVELAYTGEVWRVASGGLAKGTRYLQNLDLTLGADLAHYGLSGGSLFVYGLANNRAELSPDLIGDFQVISNIDNGRTFRLFEAWYQQEFAGARVKLGLIDLNAEFDVIETGSLFTNSSHGIGPDFSQTGENGPSIFPSTSPAFILEATPTEHLRLTLGAFDAVSNDPERPKRHKIALNEGALLVAEANYITAHDIRLALGAFAYTSRFDPLGPATPDPVRGNNGFYGIIEAPLTERVNGWLRVGTADTTINPIGRYLGGGLVLTAPFAGRPEDQLGLAIGAALIGDDQKQLTLTEGGTPADSEIEIELTYRFQVRDGFAIQPDLQLVLHPGGVKDVRRAVVIGVRFELGIRLF